MSQFIRKSYEKIGLALALAAAGLSAVWFWRQQGSVRSLSGEAAMPAAAGSAYAAATWRSPEPAGAGWVAPPPQSKGSGWLYEVFTPPVIFHDAAAGSYAVTPPAQVAADAVGGAMGLELLAEHRQPYRLQLLGYFGEPGDYLVVFVSPLSAETLLARPGQRFDGLGLTLKSFDVRKVAIEGSELGPTYEVAAFAVLQDETTGTEVVLDNRTRKFTEASRVVLKAPGPAAPSNSLIPPATTDVARNEQAFSSP